MATQVSEHCGEAGDEPMLDLRLGYIGIEVADLDAWEKFGRDAIGFHTERDGDLLIFRMDDHSRRFVLWQGPKDDVAYIGWEADGEAELGQIRKTLLGMGVPCREVGAAGLQQRGVERAFSFAGPSRLPLEIYFGPRKTSAPLRPHGLSGFVTGEYGVGHIALLAANLPETRTALVKMLGLRHTDDVNAPYMGLDLNMNFFHLNKRHHAVALVGLENPDISLPEGKILAHIMVEVPTIEDVGAACIRCKAMGLSLPMDVGKHPNDKGLSFYVTSPSGFEIELGWGQVRVENERTWTPEVYDTGSLWGHQPFNMPRPISA